ncbi:hypothetical protein WR25_04016 [Diploscapter pachys]|uniref:Maelstrom domain-containing protein n=1 Tax=Diploscapter pachys TaxID=2018661 RepID=A0A2A2KLU6_9BILA|nr:hypothetical protein WR25_04016 [Diploscapter pachys]
MSPQKMSGYFLWENLVGRKLFKEETRQNYDRKLTSHVLVMETIHKKVPRYVKAAYEAEAARMTASKRKTNYEQAANNLRYKLECSSDLAAHLPPATGTTSSAFCTLRAHASEETPFDQSYQEDLATPSMSELSASKMEIEARIEKIELEILLEENRRMKVIMLDDSFQMTTLTPRLKAPVVYEGRLASREFVNSFRMERANRFADEIFRLPKDIASFAHPYYLDFVVLSLFPYTLSQQKGQCFLASPCEIAAIRFSFSDGIVDQKVWHVRFDEEKMLGEGCMNVSEARDYVEKFKQKFGSPLHNDEFNPHLQDADQVWKELLEFAGIGSESAVTRIVYDIEQHNFIIPSLFYLSALNKDNPSISSFDLLLSIQDLAIGYNTIFGPIEMHPKVIDRYFQTRLRLLNDLDSICPLHGLNGIAHLKKLHCPFQHVARMMYLLLKFGYEAEFRDYDTMNAAADKLTCVAVSCRVNYDLSSPFPPPSSLDLSLPQPRPEPIMDDTGRPKDFEDYLKWTVRAKNPEDIRLIMEGKMDRRTSRSGTL